MKNKIGYEFMKKTQYAYLDESEQMKGVIQPPIELEYDESKSLIDLISIEEIKKSASELNLDKVNLINLIENRKSLREYDKNPLTIRELSFLLWSTQGIKKDIQKETPTGKIHVTFRTVPSAGARHCFETFLVINNVEGLKPGLYRYLATKHKLIEIDTRADIGDDFSKACFGQEFTKTCGVSFIWVADSKRMRWRYGERGIRFLHLDVGHICQNLYLAAEAIYSGVCAVAAFEDEEVNKILNIDGESIFTTYIASVGKKI